MKVKATILFIGLLLLWGCKENSQSNVLKFCSLSGSYNVYLDRHLVSYQDGGIEDQFWPIKLCAKGENMCFRSIISLNVEDNMRPGRYIFEDTEYYVDEDGDINWIKGLDDSWYSVYWSCE